MTMVNDAVVREKRGLIQCRNKKLHRFLLACMVWSFRFVVSYSQGFPCDGSFYYVATDRNAESRFYQLIINQVDKSFEYREIPLKQDHKRHITCLGYNVKDRKIYGLDFNTYELLQIDHDGSLVSLGVPENLDTTYEYHAGDMTADGRRLFVVARNPKTGLDERAYSIQVNDPPRYYAGFFPVVSDIPVAMSDVTVDPLVGVTYGFDYISGQIVATDRNGSTTVNHSPFPIEKVKEGFGSLFFDRSGQLYGLGSPGRPGGNQNTMYRIDKSKGGSEKMEKAVGGEDTDGCSCPYSIGLWKSISPKKITECQDVTIEYIVHNQAGIGQVATRIEDILPDAFSIKEIQLENIFTVDIKGGVGGHVLDIDAWTIVLGENKLTVVAEVESTVPDFYQSQARLSNLPLAFDYEVFSDDPSTELLGDPTHIEIIDIEDLKILDHTWTSCNLDTTFLTVPIDGDFIWSDGSTTEVLPVLENGMYAVTIHSSCFTYTDSLFVEMDSESLFVDLGPDQYQLLGNRVQLEFVSNAQDIESLLWTSSDNATLECTVCPSTSFVVRGNITATITIIDQRGCSASDEIRILVDQTKQIFIPSAFTPNDDGRNDLLTAYGTAGVIESFQVFNRWGNLLSHLKNINLNDPLSGWDGTSQGEKLPIGTYIWTAKIRFVDQETKQYTGTTAIIR